MRDHYLLYDERVAPISLRAGRFQIAQRYVQNLQGESDDTYTVVKYMHGRGIDIPDDSIEIAWRVLMLRGIVWDMSTVERRCREVVPSSSYHNKTPI
jgi:hypothetical protein